MSKTRTHYWARMTGKLAFCGGLVVLGWVLGQRSSLPFVAAQQPNAPHLAPAELDEIPTEVVVFQPPAADLPANQPGSLIEDPTARQIIPGMGSEASEPIQATVEQHAGPWSGAPVADWSTPRDSLPSDVPVREPPALNPAVEAKIRDAILQQGTGGETGDAILDGILEVVREQGSILDGSSLDARQIDPPVLDSHVPAGTTPSAGQRRVWLVAEQLLKAARQLESLQRLRGEQVATSGGLVEAMRASAGELMNGASPGAAPSLRSPTGAHSADSL